MTSTSQKTNDEDEETHILVEVTGIIDDETLAKCGASCRILGLDSGKPILQLGSYVFAGEYKDTLGTALFFEEDPEGQKLKYMCKSNRTLTMQRAVLKPKKSTTAKKDGENQTKEQSQMK